MTDSPVIDVDGAPTLVPAHEDMLGRRRIRRTNTEIDAEIAALPRHDPNDPTLVLPDTQPLDEDMFEDFTKFPSPSSATTDTDKSAAKKRPEAEADTDKPAAKKRPSNYEGLETALSQNRIPLTPRPEPGQTTSIAERQTNYKWVNTVTIDLKMVRSALFSDEGCVRSCSNGGDTHYPLPYQTTCPDTQ